MPLYYERREQRPHVSISLKYENSLQREAGDNIKFASVARRCVDETSFERAT